MPKARKAPQKKAQKPGNRNVKIAGAIALALSALVALSMVIGSIFTQNPQVAAQAAVTPTPAVMAGPTTVK